MNYRGTEWERRDGMRIRVEGDASPGGSMSRGLLAVNLGTGRSFWVTPQGIARRYNRIGGAS